MGGAAVWPPSLATGTMQKPVLAKTSEKADMDGRAAARKRPTARAPFGFSAEQWPFVVALVSNWIFSAVWFTATKLFVTWQPESWVTLEDKLRLVIHDAVFAAIPMLVAIAIVAAQRLDPEMMIGHKVRPHSALDINSRFILNTAEQFVLYFVGQLGLMFYAPADNAGTLVSLTVLWLLGRILFWIGYHTNPVLRAFGFGITFYPTVIVYVWLVVMVTTGYRLF